MSVFVDTSALFAVLDADDRAHPKAKETWERLLSEAHALFTTNYVLVETYALAQRRLGLDAVEVLSTDVAPMLSVLWVGKDEHARAVAALMSARRRQLSLVDCVSFELMRQHGIERCFAFDAHFGEQGFGESS